MDESEKSELNSPVRRRLLKMIGLGTIGLATGILPNRTENKEGDRVIKSSIAVIDFAPTSPVSGINQQEFYDNNISGITDQNPIIARKFLEAKATHGEMVARVILDTFHNYCFQTSVEMIPLQSLVKGNPSENGVDELGNSQVMVDIKSKDIISVLQKYPDQKIVNMSFQMGKAGIVLEQRRKERVDLFKYAQSEVDDNGQEFYYPGATGSYLNNEGRRIFTDGNHHEVTQKMTRDELLKLIGKQDEMIEVSNPQLVVKSAYIGENTERNVEELYKVARNFPTKIFLAATGNEREDLRKFKDKQPKNLIFVGEWGSEEPRNDVMGADIYINNTVLKLGSGSSFSTGYLSTIASIIYSQGYSVSDAKDQIEAASPIEEFGTEAIADEARVFDPDKFKIT